MEVKNQEMNKVRALFVATIVVLFSLPVIAGAVITFSMTGVIVDTEKITYFLGTSEFHGGVIDWGKLEINNTYTKGLHVNNDKNSVQIPVFMFFFKLWLGTESLLLFRL